MKECYKKKTIVQRQIKTAYVPLILRSNNLKLFCVLAGAVARYSSVSVEILLDVQLNLN